MDKKENCILYIETKQIKALDIPRALDEIGYKVYKAATNISAQGYNKESCQIIVTMITDYKIQYVISYDFSESIAQACFETGISYISWVYDDPQQELYTYYAFYPCNYIFVFDRKQKERLRQIGLKNVFYMPLAIMPNKVDYALGETGKEEKSEVAFVGRLYKIEKHERLIQQGGKNIVQSIEKNIEESFLRWDESTGIYGRMEEDCIEYFSKKDQGNIWKYFPYMSEQFFYEAAVTSRLIANRERIAILNTLAEKYDMRFYTDCKETEELSSKVKIMPPVRYDEISKVYCNSKINLNITLHCIETGVPQRVFDVMAAGGFMLSNWQEELEELFVPGEDIVLYHNLKELEELVEYYLTHEEERKRIAKNGQKKVIQYHDLHDRMRTVMEFVIKKEIARTKSYAELQKEEFYERIDDLLSEGKDTSYDKISHLIQSLIYAEDVPKAEELSWLVEMLNCWKIETETGSSNIFSGVSNLKEAKEKYDFVLQGIWQIESGISEEECQEFVCRMCEEDTSMLLVAWMIQNHVQDKEGVYLAVGEYMQEYNIVDAIRLLVSGVKYFPESEKLMQKYTESLQILKMLMEEIK